MRRTKIICTIGPKTESYDSLLKLAEMGIAVFRLNMAHADHRWHSQVIEMIKKINSKGKYSIPILIDIKGPGVRTGDLKQPVKINKGDFFSFTISHRIDDKKNKVEVSYDQFINDVKIGDIILIDGGLISFKVKEKTKEEVICQCLDGGVLTSRRHLNIRGRSASLPTITEKDWQDIRFGIKKGVDFIALSFVKNKESVEEVKSYLKKQKASIDVITKIESAEIINHLDEIIEASDGIMVARGDLGASLPFEEVPLLQEEIVEKCIQQGKPVIVATHLLESMIKNPTPTRAEVTDIALAVKQEVDAIMLSGETATGSYPFKSVLVMDTVARRIEKKIFQDKKINIDKINQLKKENDSRIEIVKSACILADNLNSHGLLVFTQKGFMGKLVSKYRPKSPIYAFTNTTHVCRQMNLYWGIYPFQIEFSSNPEKTIQNAINLLKNKELVKTGNRIVIVSDVLMGNEKVETIEIRELN